MPLSLCWSHHSIPSFTNNSCSQLLFTHLFSINIQAFKRLEPTQIIHILKHSKLKSLFSRLLSNQHNMGFRLPGIRRALFAANQESSKAVDAPKG